MNRRKFQHRATRRLYCEPLEVRLALSSFTNPEGLTLSFVPDGTKVQGTASSLEAKLAGENGLTEWQIEVARAFQTWVQYANVNIGVVPDGGQPLGVRGPAHDDGRFGDIRIAGIPLAADTTGEAIAEQELIAGSWAGDVVFNVEAAWPDAAKLYQVALHEAGHALGLGHSADPNSPMFAHDGSPTGGPTAADIANLQTLYGARRADNYEGSNGNDTLDRAARIRDSEPTDGFDGTTPLVTYADIHSAADVDFFRLPVLPGNQGPITFQLWTAGISQFQGKITLLDLNNNVLATDQTTADFGDVLTVHLPAATAEKYYVRIEAATSDVFASGAYALVVKYDQRITASEAQIKSAVLGGFQWQARTDDSVGDVDVRKLLIDAVVKPLEDDQHADDSTSSGRALTPVFDTAAVRRFQFVGTISDATDRDVYRLRAQSAASAARGLTIAVELLESNGLIPHITIFNKDDQIVPTTFVANGDGLVMVRAANIVANEDYFVRIAGSGPAIGNYSVRASFDESPVIRTEHASGELTAAQPQQLANLYVARPQLFSFALASLPAAGAPSGQTIWATVYDDLHRTVAFLGAAVGDFRSGDSVLLPPGTYFIRFEGRSADGDGPALATYRFFADAISDPIGPPLVDPESEGQFGCSAPEDFGLYCYPGEPPTTDPFDASPSTSITPEPTDEVGTPLDEWFIPPDFSPTNPIDPVDVNNDTFIAADDVLDVINYINANGSGPDELAPALPGYLDTDNDGYVAASDVLMVINDINATPSLSVSLAALNSSPFSSLSTAVWEGEAADWQSPVSKSPPTTTFDRAMLELLSLDSVQFAAKSRQSRLAGSMAIR